MCELSKREQQVLDELLGGALPEVAAIRIGVSKHAIGVYKTKARRKVAKARRFLKDMKKYESVLFPRKRYKGL